MRISGGWPWRSLVMAAASLVLVVTLAACNGADERSNTVIDVNEQGPNGQHMIFWRIQQGDFAAVEAFLDAGVDINIRGFRRATPAIWAATSNSWKMVLFLADKGANLGLVGGPFTVSILAKTSQERLKLDTAEGRALLEVIEILKQRGLW